jgi:RecA-family ATPase
MGNHWSEFMGTLNAEDLIDGHTTAATDTSATTSECPLVPVKPHDQNRLKPILWSDLHKLPKRQPLVEGFLDCTALSVMYGPSGCGKTFFALDVAAHIARGQVWRGRAVLQGAAVYVAAEGGYGILERLTAFSCQYGIDPKDVPLYVIPEPIDLCHSDIDVDLLMDHLRTFPKDQPVRFLSIDTTSRALAGGNENSSDHMGALVQRCDKLRAATGAHLMLLHHTGKDITLGARGHSLLRAAVDTEIEMTWTRTDSLASLT